MKISTILDQIDSGQMALPEFQRGYVWSRDQVRGLFESLYRRHPVGGLLVWATESKNADYRGDGPVSAGVVKLLLDGQQRMTSIYGVVRGKPPEFFDGNEKAFTGLQFNLEKEEFHFYQPIKMKDDPLWIDVTELMKKGYQGLSSIGKRLEKDKSIGPEGAMQYIGQISQLLGILDIDLHDEAVAEDKDLDTVVDIFNRVNSGGTKLSNGDLALAKICAGWPQARGVMNATLKEWSDKGYKFTLDWLLRSINTVLTGEAKFQFLHDKSAEEIQGALKRASKHINKCLNLIADRFGLDHDRVFFGRFAVPVMVRYLEQHGGTLTERDRDKLLFWFVQAGMWGRFSGSTESMIDQDLEAIAGNERDLDKLLEQLRLWHGNLQVDAGHFSAWSLGARFYPVLYLLTRMGDARDWGTGLSIKASLLGNMSSLEVHHIFPKSLLYKGNYKKSQVHALGNFCFLTKETNLDISNQPPEVYFPKIEESHPGALESQWIPKDPALWQLDNYLEFLEARKSLLAEEANRRLAELLHDDLRWIKGVAPVVEPPPVVVSGISSDDEEKELKNANEWIKGLSLPEGILSYEYVDPDTGEEKAIFDLAWPQGIQEELSEPVALMLNETAEVIALASQAGFRCLRSVDELKKYVESNILSAEDTELAS